MALKQMEPTKETVGIYISSGAPVEPHHNYGHGVIENMTGNGEP